MPPYSKTKEGRRAYYERNREHILEKSKDWAQKNPERRRAISKTYSRKMSGKPIKEIAKTESWKSRKWEIILSRLLGAEDVNREKMNAPYDLLKEGAKIDVKVSTLLFRGKKTAFWSFHPKGVRERADLYLCVCLINSIPHKILLIPGDKYGEKGISVGWRSSFDKYAINPFI